MHKDSIVQNEFSGGLGLASVVGKYVLNNTGNSDYDDLDLPLGKTRLREKGSAGGHNGLKSIISHIKTQEFRRIRIGIDSNPLIETKNYVLGKFSKKELETINPTIKKVEDIITDFSTDKDFLSAGNRYRLWVSWEQI